MRLMCCPLNGYRNIAEFTYGGEFHPTPNPAWPDSRQWAEYIFFDNNEAGAVIEWWCHTSSSYWFLAERNLTSGEVIRTFPAIELFKCRVEFNDELKSEAGS